MSGRILIFYISRFSGHYHAAEAISQGFLTLNGSFDVIKLNAFSYTNPFLEKVINRAYMGVIQKRPEIWGDLYDDPEVLNKLSAARNKLHEFNMPKMKKLLEVKAPDAVICTQAFPCGMVAAYKARYQKKLPLIGVLTDYAAHSYWLFNEVDHYVVPSEECRDVFLKKDVPQHKIHILGIPVNPKFKEIRDKTQARAVLALPEKRPTILLMGGSQGLGRIEDMVENLLRKKGLGFEVLVAAGSNKKLFKRLTKMKSEAGDEGKFLKVYPFVDFIDLLMDAADLLVTKAGGSTVAEALAKGKPLLIIDPIPGHERKNVDYLVSKGAAVELQDPRDLMTEIQRLFNADGAVQQMEESSRKISHPDSSSAIAALAQGTF